MPQAKKSTEDTELEEKLNEDVDEVTEDVPAEEDVSEPNDPAPEYVMPESGIDGPELGNKAPLTREEADKLSEQHAQESE